MPIFVEVLLGHDAEVVVTIFDVVLLLDAVGFDEPIFVVVLLLDEVDVINGLDVVAFPTVLDVQGVVGDVMCILLSTKKGEPQGGFSKTSKNIVLKILNFQ